MIGVYLLFKNNKVAYVGQSQNIKQRLSSHGKWFDSHKVIECGIDQLNELEAKMIKKHKPELNKLAKTNRNQYSKNYGRSSIFHVRGLEVGDKIIFPESKNIYIYQYINNFNRQAKKEGRPHRYTRWEDLEGTLYIKRTA